MVITSTETTSLKSMEHPVANSDLHMFPAMTSFARLQDYGHVVMVRGDGIWLWDNEGRRYLDAVAGLTNVTVGHGRAELVDAARRQMAELAYATTFSGLANTPALELADLLATILPGEISHIHFTLGGSDANETAIKISRLYFHLSGKPHKQHIISRIGSFHGVTYGALSATASVGPPPDYRAGYGELLPNFSHIDHTSAEALEDEIHRLGPGAVAAFLAEPVANRFGVTLPSPTYWSDIRRICDEYDVLLIADEVVTAFGRTGKLFGLQNWDINADIVCLAKGLTSGYLPLGAVCMSSTIANQIRAESQEFISGHTACGHPVCCAVGLANVNYILENDLSGNAIKMGQYLSRKLQEEGGSLIRRVWGMGLMMAFEVDEAIQAEERDLGWELQRQGLLVRQAPKNKREIQISPPLTIGTDEADEIVNAVISGLQAIST